MNTSDLDGHGPPPDSASPVTQRADLVRKAIREWINQLIDRGGRNNLLYYRDLKLGTLDLTNTDPKSLSALLSGRSVRVSKLFPDPEEREASLRRVRAIYRKSKENLEERGLETLHMGCGLATWENKGAAWQPSAPVIMRAAKLHPAGASQDDFDLNLHGEMDVNQALEHFLKVEFNCDCDRDALLGRVEGDIDQPWELDTAYAWLKTQARQVPGFGISPRLVLANFAYTKLSMVKDLEGAFDELVGHDLIAAIAGDEGARTAVEASIPDPSSIPAPDDVPVADEFLLLDADSSQNYAINAVLAGESIIIKGPPGTGKSQTIANLIGALVARGRTVLFVAEKRAAIEAVFKRLDQHDLQDVVLDLHGGVTSRRAFAQRIEKTLNSLRSTPRVDLSAEQRQLEKLRGALNRYVSVLHEERAPWGVSVYSVRAELTSFEANGSEPTRVRFRGDVLNRLSADTQHLAAEQLVEFAQLGGTSLDPAETPWFGAPVHTVDQAREAFASADQLSRRTWPATMHSLSIGAVQTGLPISPTLEGWGDYLQLWAQVRAVLSSVKPAIYDLDLKRFSTDLAPASRGGLSRIKAMLGSRKYRQSRRQIRNLQVVGKLPDRVLLQLVESARDQARACQAFKPGLNPVVPADLDALASEYEQLDRELKALEKQSGAQDLARKPTDEVDELLDRLANDQATLAKLPELHRLRKELVSAGLEDLLDELIASRAAAPRCSRAFRYAWLKSILDYVSLSDVLIGGFAADKQYDLVTKYQASDREYVDSTARRLRRVVAERATKARDEFRSQAELVENQANRKRLHMPVRDLFASATDALLALKPCWAMSPLVVSQLLPAQACFDVVIFDEASQITPADAVSSILRGRQLVVAGDQRQLPPTAFFVAETEMDEEEMEEGDLSRPLGAGTVGFESILDALTPLLRFRTLLWHYRSQDERLIAFSNAHIYDRMLTTFPGVGDETSIDHFLVPKHPGDDVNSPAAEVSAVVALVLETATAHPDDSLGVIAMGIKHANRIDEELRRQVREHPELDDFFSDDREEAFFVKNLERVQGDERDAIILSIGYGKNERDQLVYRFGPILTDGGERRLNVAVTRAKKRLTLVSSFASLDMEPERLNSEGMKLLRQYLQYVESGGTNLGDIVLEKPALNPFEIDVRDTLTDRDLRLTPQYGSSGYWIDFAVKHPTQPGRYVLAIECDGATYHSSLTARERDRLRQEQLARVGWRFHRIWSSEWFHQKERAVGRVLEAYQVALREADQPREEALLRRKRSRVSHPSPWRPPGWGRARVYPEVGRSISTRAPSFRGWSAGLILMTCSALNRSSSKRRLGNLAIRGRVDGLSTLSRSSSAVFEVIPESSSPSRT